MKKLLIIVILSGALLRFYDVNWDSYNAFHPDERNISWAVTRIHFFDQLNPKFFAYGGLPIYLYRALGEGVVAITHNPLWLVDWGHIAVIGRYVSALLSTITLYLVFLVAASFFNERMALASTILVAFSPWTIRQAHFSTTETMLVFFVLLLLYLSNKAHTHLTKKQSLLIGAVWGLALAAKTTSALFGIIPFVAVILSKKRVATKFLHLLIIGVTALDFFFICSPFTLLDWTHFYQSMQYESGVALGKFSVPYTLQFFHTPPYLYQLLTMLWQAGPLVIAGLIGLILLVSRRKYFLFISFPVVYFGWVGSWYTKFARYNVPFLPFLTIAAAWFVVRNKWLLYLTYAVTIVWCLMNFSVYLRPQTRIAATEWIYQNIPNGARIYTEHWNDGLPLEKLTDKQFQRELLTVYDNDSPQKKEYFADKLSTGDYIILSTRRIWATMPRLSQQYPITSKFYVKLLQGQLGYQEVATFTSYPFINDDTAEESIQVFDHPTVRIFKNTQHLTKIALLSAL